MPTPVESAHLILKLFELRREPLLREARAWFVNEFNPASMEEVVATASGEKNAWIRMVLGYWDMAASFVTLGAIDPVMFQAANGEMVPTFAKIEPFLADFRRGSADYLKHLETVVRAKPVTSEELKVIRDQLRAAALARKTSAATTA